MAPTSRSRSSDGITVVGARTVAGFVPRKAFDPAIDTAVRGPGMLDVTARHPLAVNA